MGVQRILEAQKTAVDKLSAIAGNSHGHGLSYRVGSIPKRDVLSVQ